MSTLLTMGLDLTLASEAALEPWAELADGRSVVLFDHRGLGASGQSPDGFTLDGFVRDLDAVVSALGDEVDLLGRTGMCHIAVRYAATHPERVGRLCLSNPLPVGASPRTAYPMNLVAHIADRDWEFHCEMFSLVNYAWTDIEYSRVAMERMQSRITPELWGEITGALESLDAYDDAPSISAPTLVVISPGRAVSAQGWDVGMRQVAASIPGSRLISTSATGRLHFVEAVSSFLDEEATSADGSSEPVGAFQTILFTDLESSTALTQRVGDEAAQDVLQGHNTAVRGALEASGGREVKHTGDGIMASFPSAVSAVEASLAIQRELEGGEVRVRIGINAGEPIAEDDGLFGTAVQLAARITDRAEPGQVLVSRVVMDLCAGKTLEFTSAGDATMKGFDEPIALYAVRER